MTTNVAASIRARLLNRARTEGTEFQPFLRPVRDGILVGESFDMLWPTGRPWEARNLSREADGA